MMEALLMSGALLGPASPWSFIGAVNLLSGGPNPVQPKFPSGIQAGDLVVGLMSPMDESVSVLMTSTGWQNWGTRSQDHACVARYAPGLAAPKWTKSSSNMVFVSVLVFRAPGWSSVRLESQAAPAAPKTVDVQASNELLLSIGMTPGTTKAWVGHMPGELAVSRVQRENAPAMQVFSANVDRPRQVSGIYVDATSGAERNLLISAF